MKKVIFSSLACTLAVLGMSGGRLLAEGPDNGSQMQKLYENLALAISGGEKFDPKSNTFICIRSLGIPIRQGFSENNANDQFLLSQQFDYIPEINHYYHSSILKFSDVYAHVLKDKVIRIPPPDPAMDKDIAATKKYLDSKMKEYNAIQQRIVTATNALSLAKGGRKHAETDAQDIQNLRNTPATKAAPHDMTWTTSMRELTASQQAEDAAATKAYNQAYFDFTQAKDAYRDFGGDKVKEAIDHLTSLNNSSGGAWWKDLTDEFAAAKVSTGRDQYEILFFPQPSEWNPVGGDQGVQYKWPAAAYAALPNPDGSAGVPPPPDSAAPAPTPPPATAPPANAPPADAPPADAPPADAPPAGDSGSTTDSSADGSSGSGSRDESATAGPADDSSTGAGPAVTNPGLSWTTFRFAAYDESNSTHASQDAASFSASFSDLFSSASGGASSATNKQIAENHDHSLKISVDLASVTVFRPWLDMSVFLNGGWWFRPVDPNNKGTYDASDVISYGHEFSAPNKQPALMPLFYNQIILARNLVMSASNLDTVDSAVQHADEQHMSCNYGCFNMSGAKSNKTFDTAHNKKGHVTEITVKGVQVIAYVCTIVPKSPVGKPPSK